MGKQQKHKKPIAVKESPAKAVFVAAAWERLLAAHPNYPDRPKVESLIASLPILGSSDTQGSQDDDGEDVTKGIKELFQRMKTRRP